MIGVADDMKGQVPAGFVVLNAGVNRPTPRRSRARSCKLVRDEIGPVAAFKTVMTVKRLPKTRSGKILRGTMRQIADGEHWKMPATIDDPAILDEITDVLKGRGMVALGEDCGLTTGFARHTASWKHRRKWQHLRRFFFFKRRACDWPCPCCRRLRNFAPMMVVVQDAVGSSGVVTMVVTFASPSSTRTSRRPSCARSWMICCAGSWATTASSLLTTWAWAPLRGPEGLPHAAVAALRAGEDLLGLICDDEQGYGLLDGCWDAEKEGRLEMAALQKSARRLSASALWRRGK